jgi:hypothetical protein
MTSSKGAAEGDCLGLALAAGLARGMSSAVGLVMGQTAHLDGRWARTLVAVAQ